MTRNPVWYPAFFDPAYHHVSCADNGLRILPEERKKVAVNDGYAICVDTLLGRK